MVQAAIPDDGGTFHGCVNNATGVVRIVDPSKPGSLGSCITTGAAVLRETAITWNQQGVPGTAGAPGAVGAPGATGPQGRREPTAGRTRRTEG